jgi:hypothetical protein
MIEILMPVRTTTVLFVYLLEHSYVQFAVFLSFKVKTTVSAHMQP